MKEMLTKDITLLPYQDEFFRSPARFSAIIAAVGTGKTYTGLLRAWNHCKTHANALGLIVRKEFVDLKMSTIADFEMYFGVKLGSDKSYRFPNGSIIMFTHGNIADINVLKNINLSFYLIEQAEEYDTAEIFDFLRDRLRRKNAGPRWGAVIANAKGHNWIYERFIGGAECDDIDKETGQHVYTKQNRYLCSTANTFANAKNLPQDFLDDLKAMEIEAPTHYYQYVMNDFNVVEQDDLVFTQEELTIMKNTILDGTIYSLVGGCDVARFGKDLSVCVGVENIMGLKFRQTLKESWGQKDAVYTAGRISDFVVTHTLDACTIDGDGLGGPIYDNVKELISNSSKLCEFNGGSPATDSKHYANIKTEIYFTIKHLAEKNWIQIQNQEIINELSTIAYRYDRRGRKIIVPKDEMRKKGIPSPNFADAFMMAVWLSKNKKSVYKGKNKMYNNGRGKDIKINDPQTFW